MEKYRTRCLPISLTAPPISTALSCCCISFHQSQLFPSLPAVWPLGEIKEKAKQFLHYWAQFTHLNSLVNSLPLFHPCYSPALLPLRLSLHPVLILPSIHPSKSPCAVLTRRSKGHDNMDMKMIPGGQDFPPPFAFHLHGWRATASVWLWQRHWKWHDPVGCL